MVTIAQAAAPAETIMTTDVGSHKLMADLGERSAGARPLVVEARIDPAQYEVQF